jgi:SAM-dependent methyltransferase
MASNVPQDKSNGYEDVAERFICVRNPRIGAATVREWSKGLPGGASILDLGCGHGVPISETLIKDGFALYGVDASAKMITAYRGRFPTAYAECSAAERSEFFRRTFDGVVAWGLVFLLPADAQMTLIGKVARALNPGGKFLFTSPQETATWLDSLTGHQSRSLGVKEYQRLLRTEGLKLVDEQRDEGANHYYLASKP